LSGFTSGVVGQYLQDAYKHIFASLTTSINVHRPDSRTCHSSPCNDSHHITAL